MTETPMRFIVASCKSWNRERFEQVRRDSLGQWAYVATRKELSEVAVTMRPRYIFFLHWNWLVPRKIFEQHECVCFHMTDVPYGRGGSPLQNLIVAELRETKVTALRMVGEIDAGPVYAKRSMSLEGRAEDIYMRASELSWEMIDWIIETEPVPIPQQGEVTSFSRRTPEQSTLPKKGELAQVYDHIRMLDAPTYPPAFIEHGDFRIEFSSAELDGEKIHAQVLLRRTKTDVKKSHG